MIFDMTTLRHHLDIVGTTTTVSLPRLEVSRALTAATLCVGAPHRGCRESNPAVLHLEQRGTPTCGELGIPRFFRSSTSNLDDLWDSGGEHGRSGPNPPYGASSGWWVILPWRLGAVHESLAHRLPGGIQAQSLLWGPLSTCDPHATPWVALCAVNSEDPTKSTAKTSQGSATVALQKTSSTEGDDLAGRSTCFVL